MGRHEKDSNGKHEKPSRKEEKLLKEALKAEAMGHGPIPDALAKIQDRAKRNQDKKNGDDK